MNLVWSDSVKKEIRKAYSGYYDHSPLLADDWSDELDKKVALLMQFPEMGRIVPDVDISFIREVFVRKYRLVYQHQDDTRAMGRPLGRI